MYRIRPLENSDLEAVRVFTDREIGAGYYSPAELQDIFARSQKNGIMCSLVLVSGDGEVKGVRISYPPGHWSHGKGNGLNPELWPHALSETGYFQSLFLAQEMRGQGWGGRLSEAVLERLAELGAKGVVCHAWKESPHNSSARYLQKVGFQVVAEHPGYWRDVPYDCSGCGVRPCRCTALEMYLDLQESKS